MRQIGRLIDRRLAKTLVILQVSIIPFIGLIAGFVWSFHIALNAVCGAVVCWLASSYFAWQSFRTAGASASKQILSNMYKGMIGKFVILIVGFIVILTNVKPVSGVALFCGFILVQSMSWFAPIVYTRLLNK